MRELETVEEGLLPQRQKWQRWHQHPCSAEWKAMEIREGGGSADERELMNSRRIIELLETKEEVQKAQIATLEEQNKALKKESRQRKDYLAMAEEVREDLRSSDRWLGMVDFWRDRATMWGASLTDRTEELVHAKRHIAQQEEELRRLELELLQSKKNGATPAKKRRRKEKKVKFDEDVVEAAAEMASEREDRIWQVGSERRQAEQEELQRGLVRTHPCA